MDTADRYSRLVLWLKVSLPLIALAIMSVLFFAAETLDPDAAIPYAKVDVERAMREQGITTPSFGAVTQDGVSVSLSASSLRPKSGANWRGTDLEAVFKFPERGQIELSSSFGNVNPETQEFILEGLVQLQSTTGYQITADRIYSSFGELVIRTDGPVEGIGPAGTLKAGQMELTQHPAQKTYTLIFSNGVRLLYTPEQ